MYAYARICMYSIRWAGVCARGACSDVKHDKYITREIALMCMCTRGPLNARILCIRVHDYALNCNSHLPACIGSCARMHPGKMHVRVCIDIAGVCDSLGSTCTRPSRVCVCMRCAYWYVTGKSYINMRARICIYSMRRVGVGAPVPSAM